MADRWDVFLEKVLGRDSNYLPHRHLLRLYDHWLAAGEPNDKDGIAAFRNRWL